MFIQYNEEYKCWGIYRLVQHEGKIMAECIKTERTKEAAIRKMHKLYDKLYDKEVNQ